jgi:hypothetical protein
MSLPLPRHDPSKRFDASQDSWLGNSVRPSDANTRPSQRVGFSFKAEVDLAELDERGRPGAVWVGKSTELSRGHIVVCSRRMCYEGREILVAVHLVDDRPIVLFGVVRMSEYEGEGQYKTVLDLATLPETDAIQAWITELSPRS